MEALVKGTPEGIRDATALAAGTTRSYDLTRGAGRYVKLIVDQNCLFAFSSHAHDSVAGPGDMVVTGAVTLGQQAVHPRVGFVVVPDDVDAGAAGVQRWVDPAYPFLLVRPKTAATALIKIKPTSGVHLGS